MDRIVKQGVAAVLVTGALFLPIPVHGQQPGQDAPVVHERPPPIFPWAFAALSTLVILAIMCIPTRKASS